MTTELVGEFEARRVERMLRQLYGGKLAREESLRVCSGTRTHEWVEVVLEWANQARTHVYQVEARVSVKTERLRDREAVELLYDLLAAQFDDLLSGDRQPFTGPKWEGVQFAGHTVFLRGQVRNEAAESTATALLDAPQPTADAIDPHTPEA